MLVAGALEADTKGTQGVVLHSLPPTLFVLLSSADIRVIPLSLLLKPSLKLTPFGEEMEPTKVNDRLAMKSTNSKSISAVIF